MSPIETSVRHGNRCPSSGIQFFLQRMIVSCRAQRSIRHRSINRCPDGPPTVRSTSRSHYRPHALRAARLAAIRRPWRRRHFNVAQWRFTVDRWLRDAANANHFSDGVAISRVTGGCVEQTPVDADGERRRQWQFLGRDRILHWDYRRSGWLAIRRHEETAAVRWRHRYSVQHTNGGMQTRGVKCVCDLHSSTIADLFTQLHMKKWVNWDAQLVWRTYNN